MNIAFVTYTHGDEIPPKIFDGIDVLIANPMAKEKNVRSIDADLNRCFGKEGTGYEFELAKILEKDLQKYAVVYDIHRTTAKTKFCAIITKKEDYVYALPFAPEAVVIMHTEGSLISSVWRGVALEYPEEFAFGKQDPPLYEQCGDMAHVGLLPEGVSDFSPISFREEIVYPFLAGEKAYNGKCFLLKKITY